MKKYLIYAFLSLALFCPRAMQAQTPGGISNATPIVWLTPDAYANGIWTNKISNTVGDFINPSGTSLEKPGTITSYNFHPAVVFTKSSNNNARNRLESQNTRNIGSDNNITAIFVHKRKTNGYAKHDFFSFNYNSGDNGHIVWNNGNANNNQLTVYWPATTVNFEQNRHNEGILTVDINNSAGSRIESYLNGVNYQSTGNHGGKVSYNTKWVLGAGYSNSYGYEGEVQEVIILKSNDTSNRLTVTDRQKIHSYLAIKYGITLNNDNYVNSDNYAVWNRTTNNGYNNNIFGIGRDNAAGLNQVQSCSQNSDMLTIYKGAFNTTNNNNSTALSNKTFLMLGANGESGNIAYNYSANTPFLNGNSADKVNYRSSVVYKAQVTTAGTAGGSQTVNINVASRSAKYVLVSANAAFPPASTRIYPINAFTAANVLINNGDMVAIAGFQTTPGDSKAVIFFTWLTPESYNNGVWKNLMGDGIGDFTQTSTWNVKTPPTKILGANYHQATSFVPQNFAIALNRLISKNGINISNNDAFTFILVYNAMNAGFDNQNILNFAGGTEWNLTSYSLGYNNNNNNNTLAMGWPTTLRSLGQVPWNTPVLVTVDNSNGQITTNGIRHYLDGSQIATATSASGSVNNAMVLGGSYYDLTGNGERGFKGHIQEVIMLKRPKASASFLADVNSQADFKKIHTYLAIKYGISMNSDYLASNGTVIWNNSANTGYNNHIFGIGNDEKTGLHQKQSVSASNQKLKIYVGNKLETLNSENNGVIPDGQYLIIGSNGATNYPPVSTITTGTQYENDVIGTELNFWSGAIYKAQLTGVPAGDSFKVNVLAGNSYKYAFVSKTANFIAGDTRIYTVNALGIATIPFDNMHPYIRFVGYSSGPGDVHDGLSLWLRADDPNMLTIQNVDKSDPTVSGYPDATTENTLPAITEWTDYIRNMNYTYSNAIAGASGSNVKKPVYKAASPEMNFHPAIRFYSHESSSGSYLRNNTGILLATERNQHTAIFVTNNNFTDNAWVYPMSFGSENGSYNGPQYGVMRDATDNNKIVGRLRLFNDYGVVLGKNDLFKIGSTSILYYDLNHTGGTSANTGTLTYRFNGNAETVNYTNLSGPNSTFNMNTYSIISGGYAFDRIINGVMAEAIIYKGSNFDSATRLKIVSYLAFKYGITLRSSSGERSDYILSNNTMVWNGTQSSGKYVTYYNDIAAVVHDDASMLNNQQAHSTDQGSILHMGVAGTKLGGDDFDVDELQNGEAVAFGHDNVSGITDANVTCGDFKKIFNRKWYVHKVTNDNRPITMLVGGEDNSKNNLGKDAEATDKTYYDQLKNSKNKFFLLVASNANEWDPANINSGDFRIIPMYYVNGEHQCSYTFTTEDTYITFAYIPDNNSSSNCPATVSFEGKKTFKWLSTKEQWIYPTHTKSGTASAGQTFAKPAVDLGDNISVATTVRYDTGLRAPYGFPSAVNIPSGSLEIRRTHGTIDNSKVTVTIDFKTTDTGASEPVIPEFTISGLDAKGLNQRDKVTITGNCKGTTVYPKLSPAGNQPSFYITNNTAQVNKNQNKGVTDKNGALNVAFESGVTSLSIEYKLTNAENSLVQNIVISPITFFAGEKPIPVPPIINEDGIGFRKEAKEKNLTSCEEVEYVFHIQNTNRIDKYFKLYDKLPANMVWKTESVGLDEININNNKLDIWNYGGTNTLIIDSILVPCASTLKITATAQIDELAPTGDYPNYARITYEHFRTNGQTSVSAGDTIVRSVDYDTQDLNTIVHVTAAVRAKPVTVESITYSPERYSAKDEVTITMTVNNPNLDVADMYMNINWGSNFNYVPGSFTLTDASSSPLFFVNVQPDPPYTAGELVQSLLIAGSAAAEAGFTLPSGIATIRFKVKAPEVANLDYTDTTQTDIHPLVVFWNFFINNPDACVQHAVDNLKGEIEIPYTDAVYIENITDPIGPNTGGAYTHNSSTTGGTPVHWGINTTGTVTLTGGENFEAFPVETIIVKFGGVPATNITVKNDNVLTCTPPAATVSTVWNDDIATHTYSPVWGYEGNVDVELTLGSSLTGPSTLKNAYTYRAPMTITGVSPNHGNTKGGDEVTVNGHNFFLPNGTKPASISAVFATSGDASPAVATVDMNTADNNHITVTSSAHQVNSTCVTIDNAWEKTLYASFTYAPMVFIEDGDWSEYLKWEDHSNENILPYPHSVIHIKANCRQDISVDMDSITVHPQKSYTVNSGKTVKANVFTLRDNASFLNYGTDNIATGRLLHLLAKARNWYVSSPMQGGTIPSVNPSLTKDKSGNDVTNGRVEWYNEPNHQWQAANGAFTTGRGYTAFSEQEDIAASFTGRFTDGNTNSPVMTRQNDTHPKRGFNLIGNPFPSYWRWTAAAAQTANTYSTIWYRTNVGTPPTYNDYQFWAYNAAGDIATAPGWNDITQTTPYNLAILPPMQAFWVRLRDGVNTGTLTFANTERRHADLSSNLLKAAPAGESRPLLRLNLSDGQRTDETVIYADPSAKNSFDDYDSDKWLTGLGAEIFTLPTEENRELSINGFSEITAGMKIPLGFQVDKGGFFSFRAKEILNLDTLDVILRDKWTDKEFDLRNNNGYYFTSNSVPLNTERFSIAFLRSATGLSVSDSSDSFLVYSEKAGRITVELHIRNLQGSSVKVEVFDVAGCKLHEQTVVAGERTVLEGVFREGAYVLRAEQWSAKVVVK